MAAGRREIESLTGHKAGIISALSAITIGRRRLRAQTDSRLVASETYGSVQSGVRRVWQAGDDDQDAD